MTPTDSASVVTLSSIRVVVMTAPRLTLAPRRAAGTWARTQPAGFGAFHCRNPGESLALPPTRGAACLSEYRTDAPQVNELQGVEAMSENRAVPGRARAREACGTKYRERCRVRARRRSCSRVTGAALRGSPIVRAHRG